MNRFDRTSFGLLLVALSTVQCSVFDPPYMQNGRGDGGVSGTGGSLNEAITGGGGDSVADDERWWVVTNEHGCVSHRAPTKDDRPDAQTDGESRASIVLAMSRVLNGAANNDDNLTPNPDAWRDIGLDRDGLCSGSPTCGDDNNPVDDTSCVVAGGLETEGNYCIDNAMGSLFGFASKTDIEGSPTRLIGLTDQDWNCELRRGGFSMILKISDYNGEKNDPLVRLDMYVSTGIQVLNTLTYYCRETIESPLSQEWTSFPIWFPGTHWKIAKRSISLTAEENGPELDDSNTFDATAFVRDGYLFAELPDNEFVFAGDNTSIPGFRNIMHKPILLARLFYDSNDRLWKMTEGVLSYYVTPNEFIQTYRQLGFCENMCGTFDRLKEFVNTARDVLLTGDPVPGADCTAMSLAVAFEALEATATDEDVVDIAEPVECPEPRHPDMPRQGCTCQPDKTCILIDAGIRPDAGILPDAGM